MAKPKPTKTTAALHFEDLEPHRFEDLVRQLAYDFRPWIQLEATGRAGGDDGFDARGFERVSDRETPDEVDETDDDNSRDDQSDARQWLIQCKREKTVPPKKLSKYLDSLRSEEVRGLYGMVFAAACDFSKTTRDIYREKTRAMGVAEAHLWGKGEIEDMLFQPKNDHLLFAYFGISLQVRRRSFRTEVRARLATKRKAKKCLLYREVLIRDISDDRYPYLDSNRKEERLGRGRWFIFQATDCHHNGVHFRVGDCLAFLSEDGATWDYAELTNDARPLNDPWADEELMEERRAERGEALSIWEALEPATRAKFVVYAVVPYENILAIDEDGDEVFEGPHAYVGPFSASDPPWRVEAEQLSATGRYGNLHESKRVRIFPRRGDVRKEATTETSAGLSIPPDQDD